MCLCRIHGGGMYDLCKAATNGVKWKYGWDWAKYTAMIESYRSLDNNDTSTGLVITCVTHFYLWCCFGTCIVKTKCLELNFRWVNKYLINSSSLQHRVHSIDISIEKNRILWMEFLVREMSKNTPRTYTRTDVNLRWFYYFMYIN